MKQLLLVFLSFSSLAFSQEKWLLLSKFQLKTNSVWQADMLGNVYVADKDLLVKYDTAGVLQYSQSIKSKGRIEAILPINTMRILLFSTQQQSFTILDNTLTESDKTFDLSQMGFGYVTHLAISSQPNKLWVYDQLNSRLVLVDLGRSNQQQDVENLRGLLNANEIQWMKEDGNQLYLFDGTAKLFVFDLYGSLLDVYDVPGAEEVKLNHNEVFILKKEAVYRYRKEDKTLEKIDAPINGISQFQWVNYTFFFRSKNELLKYRLYL